MNPCSSREHIEDLDNPGFCLWCRAPMPALRAVVDAHARTERPGEKPPSCCSECGAIGGNINCKSCSGLPAALQRRLPRAGFPPPSLSQFLEAHGIPDVDALAAELPPGELAGIVIQDVRLVPPLPPLRAYAEHTRRGTAELSLLCTACGAEFPAPCAPDCPHPPDTIAVLLGAVAGGASLMLTGPDLIGGDRSVAATLESSSGALYASAQGPSIGPVLVELARRWLAQCPEVCELYRCKCGRDWQVPFTSSTEHRQLPDSYHSPAECGPGVKVSG